MMITDYAAIARASRRAQGLPDHLEDPAALAKVAAVLVGFQRESAGRDATTGTLSNTTAATAKEAGGRRHATAAG